MDAIPQTDAREPDIAHDPALGLDRRTKFEILGAVLLGLFLSALDQTVVGTALPRIVTDLGGNEYYTWVVTVYLLTSTITVPFYGKLSDLYGRKPLLMIGITLFLIGSALSGLSQSMGQLILFRGIQGVGAGALFPISLAVIGDLFTPAERGKYQGLFGAVFGLSFLIGPALGGFLTDQVSWHWVFYVNIPIGILSLYIIWRLLPNVRRPNASRNLDYLGAAVFTVGISLLLIGLTNKSGIHLVNGVATANDWSDPAVGGLILVGLVVTGVFLWIESRAKEPIVPLDLWRNRTYSGSMIATFFLSFGFFGAVIFLPRWFQVVRHESATASGYLMFPLLIGLIGSSIVSGQVVARTGRYKPVILVGLASMMLGLALMTQLQADTDFLPLWAWMFVTGVGIGPTLAVFTIVVQNGVAFSKLGVATSNLTFFRQIGGSVGLAVAGTIFGTVLQSELPKQLEPVKSSILSAVPDALRAQAEAGFAALARGGGQNIQNFTGVGQSFGNAVVHNAPPQFQSFLQPFIPQFDSAFNQAMSISIATTFIAGLVTCVIAFAASLTIPELPLRRTFDAPAGAPASAPAGAPAMASGPGAASAPASQPGAAGSAAASPTGQGWPRSAQGESSASPPRDARPATRSFD